MKKILCLLIMSVMVFSFGMVSADKIIVSIGGITSPASGTYVEGEVLIEWENGNFNLATLTYNFGSCEDYGTVILDEIIASTGEQSWDLSDLEDGGYCIKILDLQKIYYNVSVIKDTTGPAITFDDTPYFVLNGSEIIINATINDTFGIIDSYTINFGDESKEVEEEDVNETNVEINESHIYDAPEIYTITITATDEAGNVATETEMVVVEEENPEWTISLAADAMNMFSIPLVPESTKIKDVLDKSISSKVNVKKGIWSYQQGKWKYNLPTSSGWSTTTSRLQKIVPGYGYIIFMDEDAMIYGSGKALEEEELPTEGIELSPGWNLIGHRGLNNKSVKEALSSINLGDSYRWDKVLTLNTEKDGYEELDNYFSENSTKEMEFTKAYWISVITNDGPIYL